MPRLPGANAVDLRTLPEHATLALVVAIVASLCGLPLLVLLRVGVAPETAGAGIVETLGSAGVRRALVNSLASAGAAALLSAALGTALALALRLGAVRARGALLFLLLLPMMIPPHVTAIAWTQALGPGSSVLGWLGLAPAPGSANPVQTPAGLVALLSLQHLPIALLVVQTALRALPAELLDAARVCGAPPRTVLRRVLLPLLSPAIVAASVLAFIAALGNFGINALIGIPARYTTLPVLIWQRLASFGPSVLGNVATLSTILALLALALVILSWRWLGRGDRAVPGAGATLGTRGARAGGRPRALELALWAFVALALLFPLLSLVAGSLVPTYGVALSPSSLTLRHYAEVLFGQAVTLRAFVNSSLAAGLAALAIALLALPAAHFLAERRRRLRLPAATAAVLADLAYAVPGLVMSVAFILVFLRPLPLVGVSLYGTLTLIGLAYVAVFLSIGLKPVAAAARQLDPALDEAARVTGAGFLVRLGRVAAPALAPAAASGAVLVFLTAYNEITVSALLWSSGNETVGSVIFNYEDGGYTTLAAAMSVLVVAATVALALALRVAARRLPPGTVPWAD